MGPSGEDMGVGEEGAVQKLQDRKCHSGRKSSISDGALQQMEC